MARGRRYQRKSPIRLSWLLVGSIAVLASLMVYLGRDALVERFIAATPIRFVRIEGAFEGLEPQQFETAMRPELKGSYLTTSLTSLEEIAREVPWVGSVEVSRVWPDTLVFTIDELDPVARWGQNQLISATGEVFDRPVAKVDFDHLPRLQGPVGREKEVLVMQDQLNQQFSSMNTHLVRLSLSERLAWTASLSNGLEITFGNQSPVLAAERLLELLPHLQAQHHAEIKTVDLRYARGFAISWKASPSSTPVTVPPGGQG